MKKRFVVSLLLVMMVGVLMVPAATAAGLQDEPEVAVEIERHGDIEVETRTVIYDSLTRSTSKTVERTKTIKDSGTEIANVTLKATFRYDGKTAWVDSTSVSKTTSGGWSYGSQNISTSGGTAKLTAKLTKAGRANVAVSISITCSPRGVIT